MTTPTFANAGESRRKIVSVNILPEDGRKKPKYVFTIICDVYARTMVAEIKIRHF
jgi:hypothetical protein